MTDRRWFEVVRVLVRASSVIVWLVGFLTIAKWTFGG